MAGRRDSHGMAQTHDGLVPPVPSGEYGVISPLALVPSMVPMACLG